MATVTVGVREFQENLARYLESDAPIAITQGGRKVGVYFPARRQRTEAELAAFDKSATVWQAELDAAGVTEEGAVKDFEQWRAAGRK